MHTAHFKCSGTVSVPLSLATPCLRLTDCLLCWEVIAAFALPSKSCSHSLFSKTEAWFSRNYLRCQTHLKTQGLHEGLKTGHHPFLLSDGFQSFIKLLHTKEREKEREREREPEERELS